MSSAYAPVGVRAPTGDAGVFVSAGRRGLELELAPEDLVALTRADVRRLRRA